MEKEVRKSFYTLFSVDIFLIVIGLLILFFKADTIRGISYAIGALLALAGSIGIVRFALKKDDSFFSKYGIVYGIAFLIIAFLLLLKDTVIVKMLPFALGMVMIISSTLRFDDILKFKKSKKEIWKVLLFLMILEFLFGGILTFRLLNDQFSVYQEIAVISVFFGILDIISSWICKIEFKGFDLNLDVDVIKKTVNEIKTDDFKVEVVEDKPIVKEQKVVKKKEVKPKKEKEEKEVKKDTKKTSETKSKPKTAVKKTVKKSVKKEEKPISE